VEYREAFGDRLLKSALGYGRGEKGHGRESLEVFVEETIGFREKLTGKLRHGRDRLLELNSFDAQVANQVVQGIRHIEKDDSIRKSVFGLLEHYGVRIEEHEGGDVFLDPRHAYVESFPHIPHEGMLATFDRERAIAREDIGFVSQDHPLVLESMAFLVNSEVGKSAFSIKDAEEQNILLEAIFVMETVAQSSLHVDRFMAPTPLRALVDIRGNDLTHEHDPAWEQTELEDGSLNRFLENPGFTRDIFAAMLDGAEAIALAESNKMRQSAKLEMKAALGGELQRLVDLRKLNENVRKEEVDLAKAEIKGIVEAIDAARLRLDSVRLIVEGDVEALKV
jgi:ATP-dependent helicase HepA